MDFAFTFYYLFHDSFLATCTVSILPGFFTFIFFLLSYIEMLWGVWGYYCKCLPILYKIKAGTCINHDVNVNSDMKHETLL